MKEDGSGAKLIVDDEFNEWDYDEEREHLPKGMASSLTSPPSLFSLFFATFPRFEMPLQN